MASTEGKCGEETEHGTLERHILFSFTCVEMKPPH